jgi:hypothetical protein
MPTPPPRVAQIVGLAQGINVIHSLLLPRSSDSAPVETPTFYVFKMVHAGSTVALAHNEPCK